MDLALFEGQAIGLFLHFVRTGAFLFVVPFFGRQRDTFFLRLVLSVALGSMMWWNAAAAVEVPRSLIELGMLVATESMMGFALGFALSMLTSILVSAGEIISSEMGFAMARAMDPEGGGQSTVVAQLFSVFGFLLVLQLDIHHEALRILSHTFAACPVGETFSIEPMWDGIQTLVGDSIVCALQYAFPVLAVLLLSAAIAGYAQIGVRFSDEVLQLKLERLNPASNYKRLFSMQAVVRTAFSLVKLGVLVLVLALVLDSRWADLAKLPDQDFVVGMRVVADLAMTALLWVAVVVFALALADVIWQRFDFEKRNMMTRQEVEDERKRGEGDPMVKNRLRQARTELLRHRMMQAVPKADVVITNPTHYAVALRYDRKKNAAPEVLAKGVDDMAARIREIARENKVPLMEDPPLARALFRAVKVGQEVPARFFEAVATVLSHVYRLKNRVA